MSGVKTLKVPGYQVLEYLGNGARSSIWKVRDLQTHQEYALKRVERGSGDDARFIEQVEAEYRVGREMDHPAIREVHELRRIRRWLRLAEVHLLMEYCPGRTIQQQRPESVEEAVRIFLRVADGLAYMNAQGWVHADTKPNNILVGPDGGVKVIDLGQSCSIGTVKKRIQGTPDFIAPEQVQRRPLDGRTDVYNFGATLYWALIGTPIPTILPKKQEGGTFLKDLKLVPPSEADERIPSALSRLVMDCVHMQPTQRVASMKEVRSRLDLIALSLQRNNSRAVGGA
ncbi:MAG: serine/threonine-protein kinase [Planctomycetota bacterium]